MQKTGSKSEFLPLSTPDKLLIASSVIYSSVYFTWRAMATVDTVSHPIYSSLYYAFDLFGFLNSLIFIWATWKIQDRKAPVTNQQFTVDAFVTTINESTDLVRVTLNHVRDMEYPHQTFLLDDGRRPEMKALAESMGVGYLTRPDQRHAKAGNLNHAISKTSGDLIAVFDADGIPRKDFLTKLVGYFENPRTALVQSPNAFYNLDSFQHHSEETGTSTWHEQALWYDVIQRGLDENDSATWCGSGSLLSRRALATVGGIATESVTEDTLTTLRLHEAGFDTHYHHEPLAFSLAPSSIEPYLVQRGRWALGSIQILRKQIFSLLFTNKIALRKKPAYLMTLYYFTAIQKVFYYSAPLIYLCFNVSPVLQPDHLVLPLLVYVSLSALTYKILARGSGRVFRGEVYFMHLVPVYLRAIGLGLLPFFKGRFKVTPKTNSNEIPAKLWLMPLLVFASSSAAIASVVIRHLQGSEASMSAIVTAIVAGYYLLIAISAMISFGKRPVSHVNTAFFDHRPLHIETRSGSPVLEEVLGVTTMISEGELDFIHRGSFQATEVLTLTLNLPLAKLHLGGEVLECTPSNTDGQEEMFVVRLRLKALNEADRDELYAYFFEHVTPQAMMTTARIVKAAETRLRKLQEQRKFPRKPTVVPVVLNLTSTDAAPNYGVIVDVSTEGARIKLPRSVEIGSPVNLELPWVARRVSARVVRCQQDESSPDSLFQVGIQMDQEDPFNFSELTGFNRILESGVAKVRMA